MDWVIQLSADVIMVVLGNITLRTIWIVIYILLAFSVALLLGYALRRLKE